MRINMFEGARRMLLVVQILLVLVVLLIGWLEKPTADLRLDITQPNAPPTESTRDCDVADAFEWVSRTTSNGSSVGVAMCFRVQQFPGGALLIPYRENDESVWGGGRHSQDVRAYIDAYGKSFRLSPDQAAKADSEVLRGRLVNVMMAVGFAAAGWGVLWLVAWVIGWIVRGFAGIPRGWDTRPLQRGAYRPPGPGMSTPRLPNAERDAPDNGRVSAPEIDSDPVAERRAHSQHSIQAQAPAAGAKKGVSEPPRLGGWLVLPALGLIFGLGQVVGLTGEAVNAGQSVLVVLNAFWILCILVVGVAFVYRHRWTPALFIGMQVVTLASAGLMLALGHSTGSVNAKMWGEFGGACIFAAIWVRYFLVSNRVKVTFVR